MAFHDELRTVRENLENIAEGLAQNAAAFAITGNSVMHRKLMEFSESIQDEVKKIEAAVKEKLDHDLEQARINSANVLNSALAGIALCGAKNRNRSNYGN